LKQGVATVEWEASPAGDIIADSVVALLMHAQSSTASIRLSSQPCRGRHSPSPSENDPETTKIVKKQRPDNDDTTSVADIVESRLRYVHTLLKDQYEQIEAIYERNIGTFIISTDSGLESTIVVTSSDETDTTKDDSAAMKTDTESSNKKKLKCTVHVTVDPSTGNNAEIRIECLDTKLATTIQTTIRDALSTFDKI
jgi:hypothetical protein